MTNPFYNTLLTLALDPNAAPKLYRATTDIDAGDFVTLYQYSTTELRIRRGLVSAVNLVNGFIKNPVIAGDWAYFYPLGQINTSLNGLFYGIPYYMDPTLPGKITSTKPTGTDVIQMVGKGLTPTSLDTNINYVMTGTGGSATPSGPAGGDLLGTYPNPTVNWINGYPTYDLRYLQLSGGTMSGNLILNADPTTGLQAATKQYIDNLINGIDWKEAAHVGTVAALPTYIVSGGGQVLTGSVNGAIPSATTDGHAILVNERLLVKDEVGANLPNNGIYELTQVGDGSNPYILTRTSDANTSDLLLEATISVIYGSTLSNSIWHLNPASVPIVIGTTNLSWVQVGGSGITTLNTLTAVTQTFATGTSGTDFNISSVTSTHTFNLPTASATVRGALSSTDWSTFNNKQNAIGYTPANQSITISTSSPLTGGGDLSANRTISIPAATSIVDGYLKATDWVTFNNKQNSIGYTPEDVANKSSSYTLSSTTTYANTKALVDGLATKQNSLGYTPEDTANKSSSYTLSSTTTYANTKALVDGLATKQNTLTNPVTGTGTTNEIAYFTGTSAIGSLAVATYPSLTELSYVKGVTSAIQTQLGTKLTASKYTSTTNSTAVTGTTANTLATSQLITGGTFAVGNQLLVTARGVKTGTVGTCTLRIYSNTSSSLTGATLLGTVGPTTAANLFFQIERNMFIKSATNTEVANTTANGAFDLTQFTSASAVNIDWTTDKYIIFALQNSNNGDSTVISGYRILEY